MNGAVHNTYRVTAEGFKGVANPIEGELSIRVIRNDSLACRHLLSSDFKLRFHQQDHWSAIDALPKK
ncbi:MAG: hypothetical protein VXW34_06325, partial [Actinomycetota bacterium]|nr:hypothetical protein [Actinomycetota bacterium]